MANPAAPPKSERDGTNPILIVAGTVLVVVISTFLIGTVGGYQGDQDVYTGGQTANTAGPTPTGACGLGSPDDSYNVAVDSDPDPPSPEATTFRLTVRRDGTAVPGAKVCMTANMPAMQHPPVNALAKEGSGGRYETVVKFGMGGSWEASVIIAEPGKPVVSVTVPIEVTAVVED
jgi:hypothetical protein